MYGLQVSSALTIDDVFLGCSCLCFHWAGVNIKSAIECGVIWYYDIVAIKPVLQFLECPCLLWSPGELCVFPGKDAKRLCDFGVRCFPKFSTKKFGVQFYSLQKTFHFVAGLWLWPLFDYFALFRIK